MSLKFSIITPSFNQVDFIEETISSVLSQDVDLEYWVIDGGSTDGTLDILKKYSHKYKNFFFISKPDGGQSQAINKGILKCKGEVIAYLNSDDVYLPGTLKKVEMCIKEFPKVNWFYGRSFVVNERGEIIKKRFTQIKNFLGKKYSYWKLLSFNIISQPAVFIRRNIFDRYGLFNEKHHLVLDYEFWLRIGYKESPQPIHNNLARFRVHASSKTSVNFFKIYWQEFVVSLHYLKPKYFLCVGIHFVSFLTAAIWMRFVRV